MGLLVDGPPFGEGLQVLASAPEERTLLGRGRWPTASPRPDPPCLSKLSRWPPGALVLPMEGGRPGENGALRSLAPKPPPGSVRQCGLCLPRSSCSRPHACPVRFQTGVNVVGRRGGLCWRPAVPATRQGPSSTPPRGPLCGGLSWRGLGDSGSLLWSVFGGTQDPQRSPSSSLSARFRVGPCSCAGMGPLSAPWVRALPHSGLAGQRGSLWVGSLARSVCTAVWSAKPTPFLARLHSFPFSCLTAPAGPCGATVSAREERDACLAPGLGRGVQSSHQGAWGALTFPPPPLSRERPLPLP